MPSGIAAKKLKVSSTTVLALNAIPSKRKTRPGRRGAPQWQSLLATSARKPVANRDTGD